MPDPNPILAELISGITFYRQERVDGGVRTGIMLGLSSVFERYEVAEDEYDPALAWSIDLRCKGERLPETPEDARNWLTAHGDVIREGFGRYADSLRPGVDPTGDYPLQWSDFSIPPPGINLKVVCTALRRVDAIFLADRLREIGERWQTLIRDLEPALDEAF